MNKDHKQKAIRMKAIEWWNMLSHSNKLNQTVGWLTSQGKDSDCRHPYNLTGSEIEEIYKRTHEGK